MNIFKKVPGVVTIRASGSNCEKFLNLCTKQNIILKSIKYDNFGIVCSMKPADFKKLRPSVKKTKVHINIIKKGGLGRYICLRKKRYGFIIGAALFTVLFGFLTSHIWAIEISGNELVKNSTIEKALKDSGIYVGCFKYGHDYKKIKNSVLLKVKGLAWIWVDVNGTKANVTVSENKRGVKKENRAGVYNVVASYDGYITKIMAKSGQRVVQNGDAVSKGDLLISGVSATAYKGNRYIHSNGIVMADTFRQLSETYHHTKTDRYLSGRKIKKSKINILGKTIRLYSNSKPEYVIYEHNKKTKQLKIFKNIYLPVTFTTDTFCEIIEKKYQISDAQVIATAVDKLTTDIESSRDKQSTTLKKEYKYKKLKNGNIKVTVSIESNENIASAVEVQVDKSEE